MFNLTRGTAPLGTSKTRGIQGTVSCEIVEAMARQPHFQQGGGQVRHGGSVEATTQMLRGMLRSGDVVLVMGAGDIYTLTEMILCE